MSFKGFPGGSDGKESTYNVRDVGSIPGLGRASGGGHGNPLQYSSQENPMDGEAWRGTVQRVSGCCGTGLPSLASPRPVSVPPGVGTNLENPFPPLA